MQAPESLEELRREIDEIDDAIHDLLMRRVQVVERIGVAKHDNRQSMRPAREAVILRRLASRHTGEFPLAVLVRIWREMIATFTRLQGPFAVAVFAPEDRRGYWDVARDHYGSSTPMMPVNTPAAAVRAVADGSATVAVVPVPEEDDPDPWWRFLMSEDAKTPRIVARLPFCGRGNARGDDRDALAIALLPHERTGDDRTLLGIELSEDVSRGRLKDALEAAGLPTISLRSWFGRDTSESSVHVVEIADFVDGRDPRLAVVDTALGERLQRVTPLGGYAVPLALAGDRKP
ncbi:MAG TPA: chorismate mutase [Arenibaculum sp.]|nr:chorismate mutase [Arenibaculum sp.]